MNSKTSEILANVRCSRVRFWLTLIVMLVTNCLYGQYKAGVLEEANALTKYPYDTAKLRKLYNLTIPMIYLDIDTAWYYANFTATASEKIGFIPGQIKSLGNMGYILYNRNKYAQALDYYMRSLEMAQSYGKHYDYIVIQQNAIGRIYSDLGDYEKALEFYEKSMKGKDSIQDENTPYSIYFGIARVYRNMKDYDHSNQYFQLAKSYALESEMLPKVAKATNQLGRNFYFQEQYDSAIMYMRMALDLRKEIDDCSGLINSQRDMGVVFGKLQQYDLALDYLFSSLDGSDSLELPFGSLPTLKQIATIYEMSGDCHQAINYLNQAYDKAVSVDGSKEMQEILKRLIENYGKCGQHSQLPKLFSRYDSLIQLRRNEKDLMTLEAKYQLELNQQELELKNQRVELLSKQKQAERNFQLALIISIALLLVSLGLIYTRFRSSQQSREVLRAKNTLIESQKDQIEEMNDILERKLLRAQMNPHFVFNALNAIQHFITISDKKSALNYLSKFSRLIRQTLEHSLVSWVSLSDEVRLLKNYIELEMLRFNHSFDYYIEIDESLDVEHVEIPFLLIQPYVENAINHGLRPLTKSGHLLVKIEDHDNKIICLVEDNGIGRKASNKLTKKWPKKSLGMTVTQKRIELLNEDIQHAASVKIFDLESDEQASGTRVEISITKKLKGEGEPVVNLVE